MFNCKHLLELETAKCVQDTVKDILLYLKCYSFPCSVVVVSWLPIISTTTTLVQALFLSFVPWQ